MHRVVAHRVSLALLLSFLGDIAGGLDSVLLMPAAGQTTVYWSERDSIWKAPLGATSGEQVVPTFDVRGIAVADGMLLWSDVEPRVPNTPTGVIRAANFDGGNVRDLAVDLPSPSGVAIDTDSQTVYWSDLELNAVFRQPLDGSTTPQQILGDVPGIASIHSIFLESDQQKLYFGFVNPLIDSLVPGAIARINVDGSELEILVSGQTEPQGVAVDPVTGTIYWTDFPFVGTGVIRRAPASGEMAEDLIDGLQFPQGVALDVAAGHLYWADAGTGKIQRANLDGSGIVDIVANLNQPRAVALQVIPEPETLWMAAVALLALLGLEGRRESCRRKTQCLGLKLFLRRTSPTSLPVASSVAGRSTAPPP